MTRLVDSPKPTRPRPSGPDKELAPGTPSGPPPPGPNPLADYLERVAKYIPVEIIAAFLAIRGFAGSPGTMPPGLEIALFAALVVMTPLYLLKLGGDVPRKGLQVGIATVSFVVWAYAIGGSFFWGALVQFEPFPDQIVYAGFAGALVVIWSLAAGLVHPAER